MQTDDEPMTSGRWIGWSLFGLVVFCGFVFGVVTGNMRPKEVVKEVVKNVPVEVKVEAKPKAPEKKQPEPVAVKPPEPMPMATKPEPKPEPKPEIKPKEPKAAPSPKVPDVLFVKEVLPVFKAKCNLCHGDTKGIKGGLDLRMLASIKKGGDSGDALIPGDLKKSGIWERINDMDSPMPPPGKPELTANEKLLIKNWILSGGK